MVTLNFNTIKLGAQREQFPPTWINIDPCDKEGQTYRWHSMKENEPDMVGLFLLHSKRKFSLSTENREGQWIAYQKAVYGVINTPTSDLISVGWLCTKANTLAQ